MKALSQQWQAAAPKTGRQSSLHHGYELRNCPTRWLLLQTGRQRCEEKRKFCRCVPQHIFIANSGTQSEVMGDKHLNEKRALVVAVLRGL